MPGDILTLQQASELLKIDADTLRVLARKGKVPATKIGRQWRFDESLLREWVRERSLSSLAQPGSPRARAPLKPARCVGTRET